MTKTLIKASVSFGLQFERVRVHMAEGRPDSSLLRGSNHHIPCYSTFFVSESVSGWDIYGNTDDVA